MGKNVVALGELRIFIEDFGDNIHRDAGICRCLDELCHSPDERLGENDVIKELF